MALGVKHGEEVRVTVEGGDEDDAAAAMENVLKENLQETAGGTGGYYGKYLA